MMRFSIITRVIYSYCILQINVMKKLFLAISLTIWSVFLSCSNKQTAEEQKESNLIEISKEQFQLEEMAFGNPKRTLMSEKVKFTGKIVSRLDGVIKISTPLGGLVQSIHVREGQNVKKNTPLLEVGGNELIDLQQKFATSSAKITHLKSEYERAKSLYAENINTESAFMLSESEYKSEQANYAALKLKLQNIGLSIASIKNGDYYSTYTINAPMDGQVVEIDCLIGEYITPSSEIAEVVSTNNIELQLSLFEKNFTKVTKGQEVVFKGMNSSDKEAKALITRVENQLNSSTNTFDCFAKIDNNEKESFAINQLVNGVVIVGSDSIYAVPRSAIVSNENMNYVIAKEQEEEGSYFLKKINVNIGKSDKEYVELIDFPNDKLILVEGTYSINIE